MLDSKKFQIIKNTTDLEYQPIPEDSSFSPTFSTQFHEELPMCYYEILLKNHFDVDGLIDQGLAIDVNTLDTNPYLVNN